MLLPLVLSQVMRIGFRGDRPTDRPWFAIVAPESYNIALSPARAIREAISYNMRSGEHLLLAYSGLITCYNILEVNDLIFQLNRTPYQKHDPTKNTLNRVPPLAPKPWLESTNQLGLRRQLVQFKEGSSLIIARQLSTINARVLLFLDIFGALQRLDSKPTHFGTNTLLSSKKRF